jgi:hypothetical protein
MSLGNLAVSAIFFIKKLGKWQTQWLEPREGNDPAVSTALNLFLALPPWGG